MLWRVGLLECDTFPFEVGGVERETSGDYARPDLLGRRRPYEPAGPGDDTITLTGKLIPFRLGGLDELALAHRMAAAQRAQFVMRGDGTPFGWRRVMSVQEKHKDIMPGGVGFVVTYAIKLELDEDPDEGIASDLLGDLLSLFS